MKPRRTHTSNAVFELSGGNEDNSLWTTLYDLEGTTVIGSVWEPSADEREKIAAGANVELLVYGSSHPPVRLRLTEVALGAAPKEAEGAG